MPEIPPQNFSPLWATDARPDPPLVGEERELLTAYLDWHRQTLKLKCAGLTPEQLSTRAIPPSALSLHGLLRHLGGVERWWFQIRFAGQDVPMLYYSDDDPNQDFDTLDGDPADAMAVWHTECEVSRAIVAAASLDDLGRTAAGEPTSLRRILVYVLAEYARHNGHADLLRERLDGATGF